MFKHCKVYIITLEKFMKRKFTKIGNSWAMLFTKTMLEMLDVNPEKEQVEIEFDKKTLIMEKEKNENKSL